MKARTNKSIDPKHRMPYYMQSFKIWSNFKTWRSLYL